ncbi:MAG: hypothetical protein WBF17_27225 [Phycisphaerae bacterium]
MIKLWSICTNTFLQTIRQPIYTVMILVTFGLLIFTLPFTGYTMSVNYENTDQQMLEDLGLGTLRVSGLLIAAFSASGVLRREIEEKTALIVISKPVSRAVFVVGKFLGVLAAVAVAYYLCSLVFLMTVRHRVMPTARDQVDWPVVVIGLAGLLAAILLAILGNLWFGWQFTSTSVWAATVLLTAAMVAIGFVGKQWRLTPFGAGISGELLLEIAVMFMAVIIFVALAITASARLGQAMTLLVCTAMFFLGSAHPQVFGRWLDEVPVLRVLGWITPNFSHFYPQEDIREAYIPARLVGLSGLYCVLYAAGALAVGVSLFQTRELEAQSTSGATPPLVNVLAWVGRAGALLAGGTAAVILTVPKLYSVQNLLSAAALAAAGAAGWVVWGAFGYGKRWGYWIVLGLCTVMFLLGAVMLLAPQRLPRHPVAGPVAIATATAVTAAVLIVLVLPRTRRHFQFAKKASTAGKPAR